MQKAAILIVSGVISIIALIIISFDSKVQINNRENSENLQIVKKWVLPEVLDEISGIAFLDEERIAAVQDEDGVIFIYNLKESKIEEQIHFGESGDYEGIALAGSTAYVLRSDGNIFKVQNFLEESHQTQTIETQIIGKFNFEGICYDKRNNRLLIVAKEEAKEDYKPVFAYNLSTEELQKEPLYKIRFDDPIFNEIKSKKAEKVISPSEINVHPTTGDIYILEGVNPKVVILDSSGNSKQLHLLNKDQFNQAEGLTFGSKGELYISNEGKGGKANILKVELK